jgi:hypothetical protein
MRPRAKPLFPVEKQSQERRLQEEGEHAFHGQGLADHAARKAREQRPVGAELKFHGNAGHHPEHEVDAENARPKARRLAVEFPAILVFAAEGQSLQHDDQRRQPHGELGEKIVERDGEGEVQTMNQERAIHRGSPVVNAESIAN